MDDFVILTDSCCDMTARMAADLELEVLPLSLNMEDRVYHNYLDGREIGFRGLLCQTPLRCPGHHLRHQRGRV